MLNRIEKKIHPIKSSTIAAANINPPICVLSKLRSNNVFAITGNAEIDNAVPKNKLNRSLYSGLNFIIES